MSAETIVIRADDPQRAERDAAGWRVVARSWGAQLNADDVDVGRLRALVERAQAGGVLRELVAADLPLIIALDAATSGHYPGGLATAHVPLTPEQATVGLRRRAFGVVGPGGELVAMTFLDVEDAHAEVDFTVVAPSGRGRGLASAVKAASVLALLDEGVRTFRTGGSAGNRAILGANGAVGFVVDEEWLTFEAPQAQ